MKDRSIIRQAIAVVLAMAFTAMEMTASVSTPQLPNPGDTGVSKQQQQQLGLRAMGEVYKQMPVLPDSSPETQYVQQLGRKLMTVIPQQYSWPYQFHVIPQKDINAFALPGGPIFVNIGTITAADNEAELAGVLAHEMSHVYMQHSIKQMKKSQWTQGVAGVLGAVLGQMGGAVGALGQLGVGVGAGVLSMNYSRSDEAQADAVGAIIMYKAGYDPHYMARFFQKLASMGNNGPQFLSDHPNPGNRMQAIDNEVRDWPPRNFMTNSNDFVQAHQHASGLRVYTAQEIAAGAKTGQWARMNQESGSVPRNLPISSNGGGPGRSQTNSGGNVTNVAYRDIMPSGNFRNLQNNLFTISYPDNWQAYSDQSGSGVTIAPASGVSQGAIAYGVVINGAKPPDTSLDKATQDVIAGLEQSNQGLSANGRPQSIRVNGVEGRSVDLTGPSPITAGGQPERERDWLVALPAPEGGVLYLVFIAPEKDFTQLRPTYESMLRSLHLR